MKSWIKRAALGTVVATLLVGGLAACGHHESRGGSWSEEKVTQMRGKAVERIGSQLSLDAAQKSKLDALADSLIAQRQALRGAPGTAPRDELKSLIAGDKFDRSKARSLLEGKTAAVQGQGPKVLDAMAEFYDSLTPAQQQKVREMTDKRGRWGFGRG